MSQELAVVQDFMSEDFFTSDSKKAGSSFRSFAAQLRAQFEAEHTEDGTETPVTRWRGNRARLQSALLGLPQLETCPATGETSETVFANRSAEEIRTVREFAVDLLAMLGFGLSAEAFESAPETLVRAPLAADAPGLLIVVAAPVSTRDDLLAKDDATLLLTASDEEDAEQSVSRLLSARFNDEDAPAFALVLAGSRLLLTERERWAEGRYIDIDLALLLDRNDTGRGGSVDRFFACTSAAALAPQADSSIWFSQILDASVKHTESVSEELREAVRTSIELIANEVVNRRRAKGYPPLADDQAQELASNALRYLYRILFLLFAEANPELDIVPTGTTEYEAGYSLDRLRDLALVELPTKPDGTHLYESLRVLFRLINQGHNEAGGAGRHSEDAQSSDSLVFHGLNADLFAASATALIDGTEEQPVGLGNAALQQVLQKLLLTAEKKGRDRGFISYAELGINQLGRVYEGLMSYSGFFASEPLYEVAKNGDPTKGSWVVPVSRAEGMNPDDFVRTPNAVTGQLERVRYQAGAFVFRLSGRERQRSASYYTPEVLTRFAVSQALEELLTDETTADEILSLTVCEPALGSGAFALEAVNQLASAYLSRRQDELGERIDPAEYGSELQKAKAFIALHNVYGVDLNSTAVELAEISLWLDTMVAGLAAPWFGLRLRRGNSLIGAQRSVYSREQIKAGQHFKVSPQPVGAPDNAAGLQQRKPTDVYQFLLPSHGWGATAESKEGKALAADRVDELKTWRRGVRRKLTAARTGMVSAAKRKQLEKLQALSARVDTLWETARRRLQIAEEQSQRSVEIWGQEETRAGTSVTRAQIEKSLADEASSYRRLRRLMDAWCALWFWPLTVEDTARAAGAEAAKRIQPPTIDEWIAACEDLLGRAPEAIETQQGEVRFRQGDLVTDASWDELDEHEPVELGSAGALPIERVLEKHPWLKVTERIARDQAFFHWQLEFPTIFDRGGFDLQLGNPPWVRPRTDTAALLAEGDPWWQLAHKPSEAAKKDKRISTLAVEGMRELLLDGDAEVVSQAEYLGHETTYSLIAGTQPDLYRCFMEQTWRHVRENGVVTLIHPESHFTDDKAQSLRRAAYKRLRRHWQFINELMLYEIDHHVSYGVHTYGQPRVDVCFLHATSLYHPSTVERSLLHNGDGPEPGVKDEHGNWDLRPHAARIQRVTAEVLKTWAETVEPVGTPALVSKMVYTVTESTASVLAKLAEAPRLGDVEPQFSRGWDESIDRKRGRFQLRWGGVERWEDAILQGPHFHVGNPFYKQPNPTMKHNQDWTTVDLEHLPADALPVTSYKPIWDADYRNQYTRWKVGDETVDARDYYRIAWRRMAANTGERTLIPAIIPPGAAHPDGVFSLGLPTGRSADLGPIAASMQSLISDLVVRSSPRSNIFPSLVTRLPSWSSASPTLNAMVLLRTMRLNCLTNAYASLWLDSWTDEFLADSWTQDHEGRLATSLGDVRQEWTADTPLRRALDRRQAQVEIDALVSLGLGITADELCTVYRSHFPVLYGYDSGLDSKTQYWYDQNGRLVPNEVRKLWQKNEAEGRETTAGDLTAESAGGFTYAFAPPFTLLDRERDMRIAYAEFERRLQN
ncbi:Eco57I restriction-modification methylase domain-containing protein [Brevibacterium sp. UBA7493]|uniref:Eco57I restriction-modification methylase domain-containing protein n=1 Tax=Brevibacterium sp. UBA7493 TaxID=1946121 RepID=UPI00257EEACF|nr:class I SAM-dependent DNA methyltransferase [Brevibacterium sp. UBA7493]